MIASLARVLVVAPHPDDEILGAGGTIAKYSAVGADVTVATVAGHRPPLYAEEMYQRTVTEARAAHAIVGAARSIFLDLPATLLGDEPVHVLNGKLHKIVVEAEPDVVLIPYPDRHVDHRIVFESMMVATRPVGIGTKISLVAAFETLSETHWNAPHIEPSFTPTWVNDVTAFMDAKTRALRCYESQIPPFPGPRSIEAMHALATFRGTQAGFAAGEGFHVIRLRT